MTDERMDARLREHAARWRAAVPDDVAVVVAPPSRRRWVPVAAAVAAAASVVAVVALVAAREPAARHPVPNALPSGWVVETPRACRGADLSMGRNLEMNGSDLVGTLTVATRADVPACLLSGPLRMAVVDGHGAPLPGIVATFGEARPRVLSGSVPHRLSVRWYAPYCRAVPRDAAVSFSPPGGGTYLFPLGPGQRPSCHAVSAAAGPVSRLEADWADGPDEACTAVDYRVVSATADPFSVGIAFHVVLRNVSNRSCDTNVAPDVTFVDARGRAIPLSLSRQASAEPVDPPLPPGGTVNALVEWVSYCGPDPGAYDVRMRIAETVMSLPLATHPLPRCVRAFVEGPYEGQYGNRNLRQPRP